MASLGRRERTLIGFGVAIVLLLAIYVLLVEPLVDRAREAKNRTVAREAALERRRLMIAQGPRIAEELGTVKRRLESESGRLLRGPTAPLAASELQKLVKDAAASSNMEVRSERVLPRLGSRGSSGGPHRDHHRGKHPRHPHRAVPARACGASVDDQGPQDTRRGGWTTARADDHAYRRRLRDAGGGVSIRRQARRQEGPSVSGRLFIANILVGALGCLFAAG